MSIAVAYVVSPGWETSLYLSLLSLELSGTQYDYVKVFSVGARIEYLDDLKIPIRIEVVTDKDTNYFLRNKTYITTLDEDRVIYLDADTVVLSPIEAIYEETDKDFVARPTHYYEKEEFRTKDWEDILNRNGADYIPYCNAGFAIFQNHSVSNLRGVWEEICQKELQILERRRFMGKSMAEQIALSVSASRVGLSHGKMNSTEHVYGWKRSPKRVRMEDEAVVYHTGSRGDRFIKYATAVLRNKKITWRKPVISSAAHPLFLKLKAYDVLYAVKHAISGLP